VEASMKRVGVCVLIEAACHRHIPITDRQCQHAAVGGTATRPTAFLVRSRLAGPWRREPPRLPAQRRVTNPTSSLHPTRACNLHRHASDGERNNDAKALERGSVRPAWSHSHRSNSPYCFAAHG